MFTLESKTALSKFKTQIFAGNHFPSLLLTCDFIFQLLLTLVVAFRCYSRVFAKPGMYHFLCTAHHDDEDEVKYIVKLLTPKSAKNQNSRKIPNFIL